MPFKNQETIRRFRKHKGQAVIELAIFGAIIIFVIGLIFNQAMSGSYLLNTQLKAMRMALSESYKTSEAGSPSRNSAGIVLIEDRLGGSPNAKFGPIDRTPMVASGSGTMTKMLYYPVDFGEGNAIAIQDFFINGQRFPFTTAGWKTVTLPETYDGSIPLCTAPHPDGRCWDAACSNVLNPSAPALEDCANGIDEPGTDPGVDCADPTCLGDWQCPPGLWDEADCTDGVDGTDTGDGLIQDGFTDCADRDCMDHPLCNRTTGCVRLYTVEIRKSDSEYLTAGCPEDPSCDVRFDLNFDGVVDVPAADRATFSWQWRPINALYGTLGADTSVNVDGGLPMGDIKTEFVKSVETSCTGNIIGPPPEGGPDLVVGTFSCDGARLTAVNVLDFQDGDIDSTHDDTDPPPDPGLLDDAQMFSYTREGTYLRIEEGQLFNPTDGRFVRNTTSKDHYDVIQRIFRVSNDTRRFCPDPRPALAEWTPPGTVGGMVNPVEACVDLDRGGSCFTPFAIERTCMEVGGTARAHLIYIRSRIQNYQGRRWVTRKAPP